MKTFSVYSDRKCDLEVWSAESLLKPAFNLDNSADANALTNPHIRVKDACALFSDGIWDSELTLPSGAALLFQDLDDLT